MSAFVISLDFELFWGVADSRTIADYGGNIQGSLYAIPKILKIFREYDIRATWATVGMAMCRGLSQWLDIRPKIEPDYARKECSSYTLKNLVRENPNLFFGRSSVMNILDTPGQEVGTHTYSHFYCGEQGASVEAFVADLDCAKSIAQDLGITYRSIVFPRNQVRQEFLPILKQFGIQVYRGNPTHALYADGHITPGGVVGRGVRFIDSFINLTGANIGNPELDHDLLNVPASMFLRPYSNRLDALDGMRIRRIMTAMDKAVASDAIFHLWWHPHNFGMNTDKNLAALEIILQHYRHLRDTHGMRSMGMGDFALSEVV